MKMEKPDSLPTSYAVISSFLPNPADLNNYRGISLIPVPLKLLVVMLTSRIQSAMEGEGIFTREQAGFRAREETSAQVAAMVEVLRRRMSQGLVTYLLFVDLTKAYGVVPRGAMFAKLWQVGIRGRALNFIVALYESSEICVRFGGYTSPSFPLLRGLRQGCPMSPVLFDIFDNDWLGRPGEPRTDIGVWVPGLPDGEGLLAGLLFADDLEGMAESIDGTHRLADRISKWCYTWDMEVGISKCGVMCVGDGVVKEAADRGQVELEADPPTLMGKPVPVVEKYEYLGLMVDRRVDVKTMVAHRVEKARKGYRNIQALMADQFIPMGLRVTILRAVVGSCLLYGAEVWGETQGICGEGQKLMNLALRVLLQHKEKDSFCRVAAAWRELDIPPIYAEAMARRARALAKYPTLKTWISTLTRSPGGGDAWYGRGCRWMKRYGPPGMEYQDGAEKEVHGAVLSHVWESFERTWATSGFYFRWGFSESSWVSFMGLHPWAKNELVRLGRGLCMLHLCRVKSLWTVVRRAGAGFIPDEYKVYCPFCDEGYGENIGHMLLQCKRWAVQREACMGNLIRAARREVEMLFRRGVYCVNGDELVVVLMLGGGFLGCKLESWLPTAAHPLGCGAFQIARFLRDIQVDRYVGLDSINSRDERPINGAHAPGVRQHRASNKGRETTP